MQDGYRFIPSKTDWILLLTCLGVLAMCLCTMSFLAVSNYFLLRHNRANAASTTLVEKAAPTTQYAMLVTTNLVSVPCQCGFCHPEQGIVVPEHMNRIGYDMAVQVSTNYLPVIIK